MVLFEVKKKKQTTKGRKQKQRKTDDFIKRCSVLLQNIEIYQRKIS